MKTLRHIWADGSYRPAPKNTMGVGCILGGIHGEEPVQVSQTLPGLKKPFQPHGSDIAELSAFRIALNRLPDNIDVVVHMDARNVIAWLNAGALGRSQRDIPPLAHAFAKALAAKSRMGKVELVYTSDKNSPNMGAAHTLARTASTPPKKTPNADQNSKRPSRPRNP